MGLLIDSWLVVGMFVLRIGVPLAVILLLGYFLKRLDARWEAEARAEQAQARAAEAPAAQPTAPRPAARPRVDVPGQQLPFEPGAVRRPQPGMSLDPGVVLPPKAGVPLEPGMTRGLQTGMPLPGGQRCSDIRGCSEAAKAKCPAAARADQPCWQVRMEAEGQMPKSCPGCEIFQRYARM